MICFVTRDKFYCLLKEKRIYVKKQPPYFLGWESYLCASKLFTVSFHVCIYVRIGSPMKDVEDQNCHWDVLINHFSNLFLRHGFSVKLVVHGFS